MLPVQDPTKARLPQRILLALLSFTAGTAVVCLTTSVAAEESAQPDALSKLLHRGVEYRESLLHTVKGYFTLIHLRDKGLPSEIRVPGGIAKMDPYPQALSLYYATDGRKVRYEEYAILGVELTKPIRRQRWIVLDGERRHTATWTAEFEKNASIESKTYRAAETWPRTMLGLDDGTGVLISKRLTDSMRPQKEIVDGKECYRVVAESPGALTKYWICPEFGYAATKIDQSYNLNDPTTQRRAIRVFREFHKYADGLWLPHQSVAKTFLTGNNPKWESTEIFAVESVEVNGNLNASEFVLVFPVGTRVVDEEKGSRLIGADISQLESRLKEGRYPLGLSEKDLTEP